VPSCIEVYGTVVVEHGMSRSKTVVIAKLAYARPSAADAEYLPAKPVLRSDIPGSTTTRRSG
jgi:hypothetical protein